MSKKDAWKDQVKILQDYDSPAIHSAEPMYADPTTDSIPEGYQMCGVDGCLRLFEANAMGNSALGMHKWSAHKIRSEASIAARMPEDLSLIHI